MKCKWKRSFKLSLRFVIAWIMFSSCSSSKIISPDKLKFKLDFCVAPVSSNYDTLSSISWNSDSVLTNNSSLARYVTEQDVLIANATGSLPVIKNMMNYMGDSSMHSRMLVFEYSQEIQKLLQPLKVEIASLTSELDCEAYRVSQLSSYLGSLNTKRNVKFTAGAILAGAVSTILPVFVTSKTPQNIILIGSGVAAAGLGILTLNPGGKKVRLLHDRNLLEDIWFATNESNHYSPALWYILNEPKLSNTPQLSKAQIIKTRWLKFELDGSIDNNVEQLLFRNGGIYNQGNLDLRVTMLNELQVIIKSIDQNLISFVFDVSNLLPKIR